MLEKSFLKKNNFRQALIQKRKSLTDTEINTLDNNLEISIQKALKIKREDCRNFALKLTWEKCTEQYLSYMIDAKTGQPII